jgi:hypothetical protein
MEPASGFTDGRADGMLLGVGDGDMPIFYAEGGGADGRGAFEAEFGFASGIIEDFHVGPGDVAAPTGAEDLEDGFLGGEAAREVHGSELVGEAVSLFGGGEATVEKMPAVIGVETRDAGDFDDIDAMGDDGHGEIVRADGWGGKAARRGRWGVATGSGHGSLGERGPAGGGWGS